MEEYSPDEIKRLQSELIRISSKTIERCTDYFLKVQSYQHEKRVEETKECKFCGKPAYLVPSNGISRQICGCDADGYIKIGNIEMPASWNFNLELKDRSR